MLFFSKTTKGFYDDDVYVDRVGIPSDAVEITEEQRIAIQKSQSEGKILEGDENGNPIMVDAEPEDIPYDQLRKFEYPPIEDYIDGVVKGDQAQIDAYIAACLAVKAKYPKPI